MMSPKKSSDVIPTSTDLTREESFSRMALVRIHQMLHSPG